MCFWLLLAMTVGPIFSNRFEVRPKMRCLTSPECVILPAGGGNRLTNCRKIDEL